jgi:hypothetical protein
MRRDTIADALRGYTAEIEAHASELGSWVDKFVAAADALREHSDAYTAWCSACPHRHRDERPKHIDRLKLVRRARDFVANRRNDTAIDAELASVELRRMRRRGREIVDRYRAALETVEEASTNALHALGVEAGSGPDHRRPPP